jgi:hypothetical protein
LSLGSLIRRIYLLYLSQPAAERALYRTIRAKKIRSIVELGIGLPTRTKRLLEIAAAVTSDQPLRYTGIDLFEARPGDQPKLSLKQAFASLQSPGVRLQLVPGEPADALRRVANSLTQTQLLLIDARQNPASLANAWTWMPRMLMPESHVFHEQPSQKPGHTLWQPLNAAEIVRLASQTAKHARRAA